MNQTVIKSQARAVIHARRKPVLIASALFVALSLLFSYLDLRLTLPPREQLLELSQRISDQLLSGNLDNVSKLADSFQPSTMENVVSTLLSYLLAVVEFGFLMLLLNAVRGKDVVPGMLLDGFGPLVKVLLLELLTRCILTICYWALVVPGIIAAYSYGMARYLLITNPDNGVIDCLRESRRRMRGHRMDLFRLDLSFLGWALLCLVPFAGIAAAVWVLPYWRCSRLLFFEAVCASQPAPPRPAGDEDRFF